MSRDLSKGLVAQKQTESTSKTKFGKLKASIKFPALQELDEQEEKRLEEILDANWVSENVSEETLEKNFIELKELTSKIKSVSRQGAFMIGESVAKAQELLKPYRDGTFTQWLEATFGSRQSGYNMLSYYELFKALPSESLRNKYQSMAQKAAYSLANRRGDPQKKFDIIERYYDRKANEILEVVQKEFSNKDSRSRRTVTSLVNRLLETVDHLVKKSRRLSVDDLDDIKYAKERLSEILKK